MFHTQTEKKKSCVEFNIKDRVHNNYFPHKSWYASFNCLFSVFQYFLASAYICNKFGT